MGRSCPACRPPTEKGPGSGKLFGLVIVYVYVITCPGEVYVDGDAALASSSLALLSVKVHVVARPDSIATPVMPLPLGVPVEPSPSITQETESRCQPAGTISVTEAASVTMTPMGLVSPVPLIEWRLPGTGGVTMNAKFRRVTRVRDLLDDQEPAAGIHDAIERVVVTAVAGRGVRAHVHEYRARRKEGLCDDDFEGGVVRMVLVRSEVGERIGVRDQVPGRTRAGDIAM